MESIIATSPQRLVYYEEDIVTLSNPLSHSVGSWRVIPRDTMIPNSRMKKTPPLLKFDSCTIDSDENGSESESSPDTSREHNFTNPNRIPRSDLGKSSSTANEDAPACNFMSPNRILRSDLGKSSSTANEDAPARNFMSPSLVSRLNLGRSSRTARKNYNKTVQDYRRFSSRSRKKTDFFGVSEGEYLGESTFRHRHGNDNYHTRRRLKREQNFGEVLFEKKAQMQVPSVITPQDEGCQGIASPSVGNSPASVSSIVENSPMMNGAMVDNNPLTSDGLPVENSLMVDNSLSVENGLVTDNVSLKCVPIGRMMWGKLPGYDWWPGCVISCNEGKLAARQEMDDLEEGEAENEKGTKVWIKWYGENQLSQVSYGKLIPFEEFKKQYNPFHMKGIYKKAVIGALKEAAKRCKMEFMSDPNDRKPRWILTSNSPRPMLIGEKGEPSVCPVVKQGPPDHNGEESVAKEKNEDQTINKMSEPNHMRVPSLGRNRRGRGRGDILFTAYEQEIINWALDDFSPMGPTGFMPSAEDQVQVKVVPMGPRGELGEREDGEDPPKKKAKVVLLQYSKKARFEAVSTGEVPISNVCIGCGQLDTETMHPLFEGGLCRDCKELFMESAYLFDDDGTQMYCSICCGGQEVFMCDADNCAKVYCEPCIDKLCGQAEVERVRAADKWLCYMCSPTHSHVGMLAKREDWDLQLRQLFINDHEMEYDPPKIYPPITPDERRPIRVLGLFDGIGTGYLVLKELGFDVEKYVASEIDMDAINVSLVHHKEIVHVGDVKRITEKEIRAWGPFDLVLGGSPCNDLSIVNPARKGIYEGTGRLFFEFFRILSYAKPPPSEGRPFFWLYENVVSMRPHDKQAICRFLQCNPVVVDAKDISAAHRARYFWGNLPGMNRPTMALPGDRLTLQECLERNCFRSAQFTKLRTITTKMNSIKQTKKAIYPVKVGTEEGDVLWCTEMERLFGFPEHYTDVSNLGRCGRQRLLGKAWSVPVIRHLLSPLKDYFKSSTTKEKETAKDE